MEKKKTNKDYCRNRPSFLVKTFVLLWFCFSVEMSIYSVLVSINASNPLIWLSERRNTILLDCANEILDGGNAEQVLKKWAIPGKVFCEQKGEKRFIVFDIQWDHWAWRRYESDGFVVTCPGLNAKQSRGALK